MKPNQTAPLLASIGSLAAAAPPVLIVVAIAGGLLWLFSGEEESESATQNESDTAQPVPPATDVVDLSPEATDTPKVLRRQVTRDDLAEALAYGARSVTRQNAVTALQALGFKKTAAYKAVSPTGRFSHLIERKEDGLIEWKG